MQAQACRASWCPHLPHANTHTHTEFMTQALRCRLHHLSTALHQYNIQIDSYVSRFPNKSRTAGESAGSPEASTAVRFVFQTLSATSQTCRLSSDLVRQGDSSLGQPPGLLQFLRAIPPELPAQRVADASCLTVQRQPGAARGRGAGGGGGRRRHRLPGIHVPLLALGLLQPLLSVPSLSPPAPQVDAASWADKL